MKITKVLPKKLAIAWQEYDLNKLNAKHQYHQGMANGMKQLVDEANDELYRLKEVLI